MRQRLMCGYAHSYVGLVRAGNDQIPVEVTPSRLRSVDDGGGAASGRVGDLRVHFRIIAPQTQRIDFVFDESMECGVDDCWLVIEYMFGHIEGGDSETFVFNQSHRRALFNYVFHIYRHFAFGSVASCARHVVDIGGVPVWKTENF